MARDNPFMDQGGRWVILAGDIGGTKTLLALFAGGGTEASDRPPHPSRLFERSYPSRKYSSFDQVLCAFLAEAREAFPTLNPVFAASFGVSGPVVNDRCETTNLPWTLDKIDLSNILSIDASRVYLQNDLAAIAWGALTIPRDSMALLNAGRPEPGGNQVIIAPGTGLGESIIAHTAQGPVVLATEGGHSDWAPEKPEDLPLLSFLWSRFGHASSERLVSGQGLATLYRFHTLDLAPGALPLEPHLTDEEIPAALTHRAIADDQPLCKRILEQFCGLLGQEAGNMALKSLATGGVFLAGGIPGKILPFLLKSTFLEHFSNKGRYRNLLDEIPVWVISDPDVGLLGARAFAARQPTNTFSGGTGS